MDKVEADPKNSSAIVLNFLDLGILMATTVGISVFSIGGFLSNSYGVGVVINSILIGNFFLWLIGLGIIAMSQHGRSNSIQNVKHYLGAPGAFFAAVVLVVAFLTWFTVQTESTIKAIETHLSPYFAISDASKLRIGVPAGLFVSLIATGGLKWIRRIVLSGAPILITYMIYAIFTRDNNITVRGTWGLNFAPVIIILSSTLAGIVNLPTFYRHSKSKADSFFSLTVITILVSAFECFSIWAGISNYQDFFLPNGSLVGFDAIFTLVFILLSLVMSNLVNIYFATAGLHAFFPRKPIGAKELIILGLLGTGFYSFIQVSKVMEFLIHTANNFLASLGVVLICAFIISVIVKHRPRPFEKYVSNFCWLLGCASSLIIQIQYPDHPSKSFLAGIVASTVAFLVIAFIEETIWSISTLPKGNIENIKEKS